MTEQRDGMVLEQSPEHTFVFVVAKGENNSLQKIHCKEGKPLSGFAYNTVFDCYYINCVDYLSIGRIPLSMNCKINSWSMKIPLVSELVVKNFNDVQKKDYDLFVDKFKDCEIDFVQMIDANHK